MNLPELGRVVHLANGFISVGLGLLVMLWPKFGPRSVVHRWLGRVYAAFIVAACLIGVPLAYRRGSTYLMILGVATAGLVVQGWRDIVAYRRAKSVGHGTKAASHLRRHVILMGSSYVGAWSGFFATNPILGHGDWQVYTYVFGPPLLGAVFISRAVLRLPRAIS